MDVGDIGDIVHAETVNVSVGCQTKVDVKKYTKKVEQYTKKIQNNLKCGQKKNVTN